MVAEQAPSKERVVELLDQLPPEVLAEVAEFIEFQRYKLARSAAKPARPKPVKLGGLWAGVEITDEDIAEVRREMWGSIDRKWSESS